MPWSETLPQVSLAGTVLTVLLLFFAAFGEPLLGRRAFAWLSRSRDGDERALTLLHAVTMAIHVLWGLVVVAVLLLSPGLTATDLGMRLPHAWGPILGGAVGGLIALAAFWVLVNGLPSRDNLPLSGKAQEQQGGGKRRGTGHRGRRAAAGPMSLPEPGWEAQALLQPRTRVERSMAAGTALTGGLFAELLYRGLFIVLLSSLGVPLWVAAVLSVLLFSVAHLYQGWWGLASAAVSGTLFTILYLGTGSIWVPVLVHVALNLRSLAFPPASPAAERTDSSSYDDYDGYEYDPYDDEYDDYGDDYADEYRDDEEVGARTDGYEDRTERPQWAEETSAYGIGAEPRPEAGGGAPPAFGGPEPGGSPYGGPGDPGHGGPRNGDPSGPGAGVPAFGEPSTPYGAAPPPPGPSGQGPEWDRNDSYGNAPGYGATGGIPRAEDGQKLYPDEWIDRRYGATGPAPGPQDGRKLYPDEWIDRRYGDERDE